VEMVRATRPDDIGVSVSYPLPGTKFFERVKMQIGQKSNWSDSGDLSMMFHGAYTDEFYRALHDALHAQVDARNASSQLQGTTVPAETLWNNVVRLEQSCRNPRPTLTAICATTPLVQLHTDVNIASGDD
jgi:anaerobic magnesium-protoporphyrin IX monomethyl ester cyclase